MMCNIDCGAIPIKVPPADAFIPYVNRAEIAAEEAEKNAQQAKEAVESITDISNQVKQVQQLAQQAKESEVNANASAQIASAKATEAVASASSIKDIENIVKNYRDEASVSATTAIDKANEASDSATKAKASETSASTSAQTAITKANEANASANIATDKASEASASAASAKTSEDKANEYAKEAKESVDSIDTSNLAKLTEDNIFKGINTFNGAVNVPIPVDDSNAVNKNYVDNANVASATKATEDSAGNVIKDTYLKPEGVYRSNNNLTIYADENNSGKADVSFRITSGIELHSICFVNENNEKAISLAKGNKYASCLTPEVSDDSIKIANTKFVKAQSASMQVSTLNTNNNYWTKDPSGIVHQFAKLEATTEEITISFPISFPSKCLCVMIEILNPDKDISKNVSFNIIEKNVDGIKLLKIGNGNPTITVTAIGA